jgi:hypothetical protein
MNNSSTISNPSTDIYNRRISLEGNPGGHSVIIASANSMLNITNPKSVQIFLG